MKISHISRGHCAGCSRGREVGAVSCGWLASIVFSRARLKRDGTRAKTRFGFSAKRTSPFKSAGASVHSTTGSRGVRISGSNGSNAGYTMF